MLTTLASSQPQELDMVSFIILGFSVVLFILFLLAAVTSFVGLFFKMKDKAEANKAAQATTQPSVQPQAVSADTMDASLLAAISAAVFVALSGEKYNIVSIRALPSNLAWATEGRKEIFQSHKRK